VTASADALPDQGKATADLVPLRWYESVWLQLVLMMLLVIAFASYPVIAIFRPRRSGVLTRQWPARVLSAAGLVAVPGFAYYFNYMLSGWRRGRVDGVRGWRRLHPLGALLGPARAVTRLSPS
jgi:hypothetical protein